MASLLLFALFCGALGTTARAAEALSMSLDSPLALSSKPLTLQIATGRWFPIAITLVNNGDAVSGRLQLQLASTGNTASGRANSRDATCFVDVDLSTKANKRVWLYARGEGSDFDGAVVTFSGRGIKTMQQTVALRPLDTATRTVLTVSDSGERLAFLTGLKSRRLAEPEILQQFEQESQYNYGNNSSTRNTFLRPLGTSHEFLPDRAIGLESASLVVLRDFSQNSLKPEQLSALRAYVAQGGTLVVFGGSDWQRLSSSVLQDLWPLDVRSSGVAKTSETAAVVARYVKAEVTKSKTGVQSMAPLVLNGADRLGGSPLLVTRGVLRAGSMALVDLDGENWLSARDYGAGRVLLLAADPATPPFLGWRGQSNLWGEIVAHVTRPRRLQSVADRGYDNGYNSGSYNNSYGNTNDRGSTAQLLQVIRRLPQLQTPPTSSIAWFLAVYVFCLVPLNYFVLRAVDRRELAWLTIPAIAILFSVASYMAARRIKGTDLLVRQINIVQGSGTSDLARTDSMLWLYSPRRANYDISSTQPMALADYVSGGYDAPASSLSLREPESDRAFGIEGSAVKMWDEAQFIGQGTLAMQNGVALQEKKGVISVFNGTSFDLRGAVLLSKNGFFRCGDIAKNASAKASASANTAASAKKKTPIQSADISVSGEEIATRVAQLSDLEKLFPSPKNVATTGNYDRTALADSTLRDLALETLRASLRYDPKSDQRLLVAWGTTPVAPLVIEGETPRQQSVTLFLFRLPAAK